MLLIQPSHYVTHAIAQFSNYRFAIDRAMLPRSREAIDDKTLHTGIELLARECAILMHHAEKFVMPEWGRIFEKDELDVVADVPAVNRLPYPVVACEFSCDYALHNNIGPGELPSSKRIALMAEREALTALAPSITEMMVMDNAGEGFMVLPICYFDSMNFWSPPASAGWCRREWHPRETKADLCVSPLGLVSYAHFATPDERTVRAVKDFSDEVICACHLLLALGMERTTSTTIEAPHKLNKKRKRNNKPPIYEYKVLDIVADIMESPRVTAGKPEGKHASPRMHKRRGHIRRLSAERVTWVRNTIVGKPGAGEIRKDYVVHK